MALCSGASVAGFMSFRLRSLRNVGTHFILYAGKRIFGISQRPIQRAVSSDHETLSEAVYETLRHNILSQTLRPGTVLKESELSRFFKTSREPVTRAIRQLEYNHFVRRREKQGYIVAGNVSKEIVVKSIDISIPEHLKSSFDGQPTWEKIYSAVEEQIVCFVPFGRFKIIESALANHFSVSRSVTQQVISRLVERGLAEKPSRSQCHTLTYDEEFICHRYELRMELEPAALRLAGPHIPIETIQYIRTAHQEVEDDFDNLTGERLDYLEYLLHIELLNCCPNRRVLHALRTSQIPLRVAIDAVKDYVGVFLDQPVLAEHGLVLSLLAQRATDMAALALRAHLELSMKRSIERLPLLTPSRMPDLPAFLKKLD